MPEQSSAPPPLQASPLPPAHELSEPARYRILGAGTTTPDRGVFGALRDAVSSVLQRITFLLAMASLISVLTTWIYIVSRASPNFQSDKTLLLLLYVNIGLLLIFVAFVARRIVDVWVQRRRGLAGSRLHFRLVVLFSAIAVTPTIIVAVFSYFLLNFGLESWFSEKVRTALSESHNVAQAYLQEHQQNIRADVLAMAADLNREGLKLMLHPEVIADYIEVETRTRKLTEAIIFDRTDRHVVARSTLSFALDFETIPDWAIAKADSGEVAILTSENEDRVRALVRLYDLPNAMLYVGRPVEPKVIDYLRKTNEAVDQYERLERERSGWQIQFVLIFGAVALLLLLVAIWVGLNFATGISRRTSGLVVAAERVRGGDLSARVKELDENDEFGSLSRAFNRMTGQLQSQQGELVEANHQLDYRRRFTEAVLAGVTAGVIGLDEHGIVNLPNRSAVQLLGIDRERMLGRKLAEVVPEMAPLIEQLLDSQGRAVEGQIKILAAKRAMTLLVQITAETGQGEIRGYVVTFDDITELLAAQRKAAWADVARRIAHEIKNPLTPIQLSAERLKRKYLKEIRNDPETFSLCTDTIIRQVGDIGRMVDEFSAFARMPAPTLRDENLTELVRQAVFLQRTAHAGIAFSLDAAADKVLLRCDSRQISQALTNLLQNAVDAISGRARPPDRELPPGQIRVTLAADPARVVISVEDNGKGLPAESRETLVEPYVTTRAKGTGLGLAIVKKIMEDHAGELMLEDSEQGGARVSLVFPTREAASPGTLRSTNETAADLGLAPAPVSIAPVSIAPASIAAASIAPASTDAQVEEVLHGA